MKSRSRRQVDEELLQPGIDVEFESPQVNFGNRVNYDTYGNPLGITRKVQHNHYGDATFQLEK